MQQQFGNSENTRDIWYKLDNAAIVYPAVSDEQNTNVFRLSCTLKQTIDPEDLQQALDSALEDFPSFAVVIRRGMFWFYLERTNKKAVVEYEKSRPCNAIFYSDLKDLLFRVSYFQTRINLEVFHAVADGAGATQFLLAIVYNYLIINNPALSKKLEPPGKQPPPEQQSVDSFFHYYNSNSAEKSSLFQQSAFRIGGTVPSRRYFKIITATVSTSQILKLVKSKGTTVTAYLTALLIYSIYKELMPERSKNKAISVTVPVDLRGHFDSDTSRNFFSIVSIGYNFSGSQNDFDRVLESVGEQFVEKISKPKLEQRINYTISMQRNPAGRFAPLLLKRPILKAAYKKAEKASSCALSNLGAINIPDNFSEYIDNFSAILNPTMQHRIKLCICSYKDNFVLTFSSLIAETRAQKFFLRQLSANGIEAVITTNMIDEQDAF